MAGLDGAAVNKDRGNIQPRDGDHRAGHVFVAAADGQQAIHARRAANGFDGVGDDFARDQRILHSFGAHGDAVAHGDGAEDLRHGLRLAQGFHGRCGQIVQAGIAGGDGAVAVGDADDGLIEIGVAKAHRAKHRAVGSAFDALGDYLASCV